MKPKELIKAYIAAWDRHDADAILALMVPGGSYYDAFWRETCTGRDLAQYFRDDFAVHPYRYEQVGEVIQTQNSATFRYHAYDESCGTDRTLVYTGAEILTLRDGLIDTITDHYCPSDSALLEEAAELASRRHGVSRYANGGLGAQTALRYRRKISSLIEDDQAYLDPALSVAKLAEQLDCPEDHVVQTIINEYGKDFDRLVEQLRVNFARDLLLELPEAAVDHVLQVSSEAGFSSLMAFRSAFREAFGVSPTEYFRQHASN